MMTPPVLIYLGLGLFVAVIMLDGRQTRRYRLLEWLQFGLDVLRITLLWPLVLLAEKVETWRNTKSQTVSPCDRQEEEVTTEPVEAFLEQDMLEEEAPAGNPR